MKQRGFTMIELIVAVSVLAILAAFILTTLNPVAQFEKSRDARRKSDLSQIQKALEQYYQDHQEYPPSSGDPNYYIMDTSVSPAKPVVWGSSTSVWEKYIELLPKDPDSQRRYIYITGSNNQMYWLYAGLDRGSMDPNACTNGVCSNTPQGVNCGDAACNYGVSSPNTNP